MKITKKMKKFMRTFDIRQIENIQRGLENGLDVSIYADPRYTIDQMIQIRLKLLNERKQTCSLQKR